MTRERREKGISVKELFASVESLFSVRLVAGVGLQTFLTLLVPLISNVELVIGHRRLSGSCLLATKIRLELKPLHI